MHAAMDIGVFALGEMRHRVQHRARLLGRGAAVEIDQRLAIDLARQDREIGAGLFDIEGGSDFGRARSCRTPRSAPGFTAPRTSLAQIGHWRSPPTASSRKAWISKLRALRRSGMPRARR